MTPFLTIFLFILVMGAIITACAYLDRSDAVSSAPSPSSFSNTLGMTFVFIHPGKFMMGSPKNELMRDGDEKRHKVKITRGVYMQTTEVTQGQWQAVMGDNPAYFSGCGKDCPVEEVSWQDVQEFIRRLNNRESGRVYRLPTEAEWEYACRAGTTGPFSTGNCLTTDQANYDGDFPLAGCAEGQQRQATVPVKCFAPNAWGLYDMHGNVWEWCADRYGNYHSGRATDPTGPSSGPVRVFRGGGWDSGARGCRSAERNWRTPDFRSIIIGFRLAADQ